VAEQQRRRLVSRRAGEALARLLNQGGGRRGGRMPLDPATMERALLLYQRPDLVAEARDLAAGRPVSVRDEEALRRIADSYQVFNARRELAARPRDADTSPDSSMRSTRGSFDACCFRKLSTGRATRGSSPYRTRLRCLGRSSFATSPAA
jgi:hypothetical protein